jgi:hypothetical protein
MTVSEPQAGVPLPPKKLGPPRRGLADKFRCLEVGQSVVVRGRTTTEGIAGYCKHLKPMRFTARTVDGEVRVWRVA